MGNCNILTGSTQEDKIEEKSISHSSFKFIMAIGKGGFGMVWKVEYKKNKEVLALKVMSKTKIISKKSVHSVVNELQILQQLNHSFIINMICAFQDKRFLYLGMEYLCGGDLRYQICRVKKFTEVQTSKSLIFMYHKEFFIACIMIALEYMHGNAILHRDIKPENLVFDSQGYLHVTDMGIARVWRPENSTDTSGTPGYMAPEVMVRQNHGVGVDYYAVGVILYECMIGKRPYLGRSRQEIRDQVLARQVQIKENEIPENWSIEAVDIVNKLLQRKPINRLGVNGPQEIKNHNWFRGFQWNKLQNREMEAPFIPDQTDNSYQNIKIDSQSDLDEQNEILLRRNSIQGLFSQYNHGQYVVNPIYATPNFSSIVPLKSSIL